MTDHCHHHAEVELPADLRLPAGVAAGADRVLFVVAAVASVLTAVGWTLDARQAAGSYLIAFTFVVGLTTGATFWSVLHHLADAGWSAVVRRPLECLTAGATWLAVMFVPVVLSLPQLYEWAGSAAADDALIAHKAPYLNTPFFLVRAGLYFAVWAWLASAFRRASFEQDAGDDPAPTLRARALAPVAMLLLALTTTFAAFDWIMSLTPHWFSTIFGVYFWAGAIPASLAAATLGVIVLRRALHLERVITAEHLHDLGKYLCGFTVFWAYIAFSQYFLIWYANIPEETVWFIARQPHGWGWVSLALGVGRFVIPFAALLPRESKRRPAILGVICVWTLAMHAFDLYWQIAPTLHPDSPWPRWTDFTSLAALGGWTLWLAVRALADRPVICRHDPRLSESLALHQL